MGGTSVAMPIPPTSAGRMNRLPSGSSASSSFSQSPGGGGSLHGQSLSSLFGKPDAQPSDVRQLVISFTTLWLLTRLCTLFLKLVLGCVEALFT